MDGILKNTFQYLLRHRHPKTVPSKNAESVCTVEPSSEKNLYFGLGPKCLPVAFKHRFSSCPPTEESTSFPTLQILEETLSANLTPTPPNLQPPAASVNRPTPLPAITTTSVPVLGCSGLQPKSQTLFVKCGPCRQRARCSLMGPEPSVTKALSTLASSWRCKYATAQGQRHPTTEMLSYLIHHCPEQPPCPLIHAKTMFTTNSGLLVAFLHFHEKWKLLSCLRF